MRYHLLFFLLLTLLSELSWGQKSLTILERYPLQIDEISGMCWINNEEKKNLILVSDKDDFLYFVNWEDRKHTTQIKKLSIKDFQSIPPHLEMGQWESLYCHKHLIYLVQESTAKILILNLKTYSFVRLLDLKMNPKLQDNIQWGVHLNSQAEGFLPLNTGNFIIAKEKKPAILIEFSNNTNHIFGLTEHFLLGPNENFIAEHKTFFPVKHWKIPLDTHFDISEIFYEKSSLYLLSDKANQILQLSSSLLTSEEEIAIIKRHYLPKEIKKAEAILFDQDGNILIGVDEKGLQDFNLFLLKRPSF
ncbi:MAG: SdiA-regulated domain-containing protein [Bacteriovoracaceae bacterium]|jgi:hypothetical protein|nr:SdiA-regulated domain-containing protein [Bacteriovoracaceae bacterium]